MRALADLKPREAGGTHLLSNFINPAFDVCRPLRRCNEVRQCGLFGSSLRTRRDGRAGPCASNATTVELVRPALSYRKH